MESIELFFSQNPTENKREIFCFYIKKFFWIQQKYERNQLFSFGCQKKEKKKRVCCEWHSNIKSLKKKNSSLNSIEQQEISLPFEIIKLKCDYNFFISSLTECEWWIK